METCDLNGTSKGLESIDLADVTLSLLNPFRDSIISFLNFLTDSLDTGFNYKSPSSSDIEASVDIINGEII